LKKESEKTMNKKLAVALILPLLMIPLASFAYGHFYAYVAKRYAIHVGAVAVHPVYFHIDALKTLDADGDGIIIGDEFKYSIHQDPTTLKWYIDMWADPIPSDFVLNTTLKIHIDGKLPVRFNFAEVPSGIYWAGPFDAFPDGMWDNTTLTWKDISTLPGVTDKLAGPWSYSMLIYRQNATGTYGPVSSTSQVYYPCNNVTIIQHLDFRQPKTYVGETWTPKDWMCKKILIRCEFQFQEEALTLLSSETYTAPTKVD
jgi:hypothetical protein